MEGENNHQERSKLNKARQIVKLRGMLRRWHSFSSSPSSSPSISSTPNISSSPNYNIIDNSDFQENIGVNDENTPRACNCSKLDEVEGHKCESPEPPPDVPKGYLAVYVGPELRRFIIPTSYLTHSLFKLLLEKAEDEFGFNHNGALTIPCETETFKYLLRCIETNYDTHQHSC
ncbi:hypothetical protein PIB30_066562, partial [Stylosanthes scabra]|nr:hypothetical protein [Stylosanthes scabra]